MRYKSYVVSYIGESKKVNTDNFFLNGLCKESVDEAFLYEENNEFTSRNLFALSSGGKSVAIGDELAYIAVDILRNFHVADFESVNREYFHVANTAITSQVLERNDEHYEVDLAVLSIDRDVATVYNMGDIPVFYFDGKKMKNLAGKAPDRVSLAKDYLDKFGEIKSEIFDVKNVAHIGELSSDMEVVPYTSEKIKLNKSGFFVLCSSDVAKVLDEKTIESVLTDKRIAKKNKALAILDKAVKVDSEGCYTVEVVAVGHGLAIAEKELMSLGKWFVIAVVCLTLCVNSNFVLKYVSNFVNGCKSFVQKYFGDDEIEEDFEYQINFDNEVNAENNDLNSGEEFVDGQSTVEMAETLNEGNSEEQSVEQAEVIESGEHHAEKENNTAYSTSADTGSSTTAKSQSRPQNVSLTPNSNASPEINTEQKTVQSTPEVKNEETGTAEQREPQSASSAESSQPVDVSDTQTTPNVQESGANELPFDTN